MRFIKKQDFVSMKLKIHYESLKYVSDVNVYEWWTDKTISMA